jgi:hypothetical protein
MRRFVFVAVCSMALTPAGPRWPQGNRTSRIRLRQPRRRSRSHPFRRWGRSSPQRFCRGTGSSMARNLSGSRPTRSRGRSKIGRRSKAATSTTGTTGNGCGCHAITEATERQEETNARSASATFVAVGPRGAQLKGRVRLRAQCARSGVWRRLLRPAASRGGRPPPARSECRGSSRRSRQSLGRSRRGGSTHWR